MRRIIIILGALMMNIAALCAQEIISGTVIDEKNQPVPGARVEADGRTEFAITDIDGLFRLEVPVPVKKVKVSYVGYKTQTRKVQPDMVVKLNKGWRSGPQEYQWFAGANFEFENGDGDYDPADTSAGFGLMGGWVKNWGVYVNTIFCLFEPTNKNVGFTVGGIRRLWCPLHLYAGVGYVHRKISCWDFYDQTDFYKKLDCFTLNLGLLFRFGSFGITYGVTFQPSDDGFYCAQFGLNYFF